jgi:3-dehydroquinate dehydratase/shikimate dehydrogenase
MAKISIVAGLTSVPSPDGSELLAVARSAEWLEVRADLVGDLDPNRLRSYFPGRLLYSLRSRSNGGAFEGSQAERTSRILKASRCYDLVELESERDLLPDLLTAIPANRKMVSWYGPAADHRELMEGFDHLSSVPARFYKIVVEALRSGDALSPLRLLKSLGRSDVIAFASGEIGFWSRLVAPNLGAPLIFGAAGPTGNADGDRPVLRLIEDYGLPFLSPLEEIYGIVGNPVTHSLSPRMHNAAYRALRHPALFVPFHVESFDDFWRQVVTSGIPETLGFSIKGLTVASPYKEAALREAGASSSMSCRIGAANVFVRHNGHWKADTTDPEGVALATGDLGVAVMGKKAAVVGCGGAGRAMAAALDQLGAIVTLVNRGAERGWLAARLLDLPFVPLSSFTAHDFSIVVNATPVGRDDDRMPFEIDGLNEQAAVIDLVYGSKPTALVCRTRAAGRVVIDGREVLQAQVLRQFRLMTGRDMPMELIQEHLDQGSRAVTAIR